MAIALTVINISGPTLTKLIALQISAYPGSSRISLEYAQIVQTILTLLRILNHAWLIAALQLKSFW